MSSEVKSRNIEFMENESENESLRTRIRDVEDENQDLRAQNLLQKRTILQMRDEIVLLRLQVNEMRNSGHVLSDRVRNMSQSPEENDGTIGQITVPPLMAPPPPVPPPLPPTRVRISPRQVGAGEALTTPLGVTLSSPPRHRIKRDCRQGFYRSPRNPYRRFDASEPGPSSTTTTTTTSTFVSTERPNYFVGLRIIPQFQTSFVCSPTQSSGYSDSASDSSGSDETTPLFPTKARSKPSEGESSFKKPPPFPKDFELLKNVRNLHHQKVRQTILQNYNLSLPNSNSNIFFPVPWNPKNLENSTMPSTSGNDVNQQNTTETEEDNSTNGSRKVSRISDCVQYTFPTIHEGLHHHGVQSAVTATGPVSRLRKFKKNIPYTQTGSIRLIENPKTEAETEEERARFVREKNQRNQEMSSFALDSESFSSAEESRRLVRGMNSDLEQDGFQGDESSNCMTSAENSLEKISISESNVRK